MAKPPITITCECGDVKEIPYGERWICGRCKCSWNTAQIPVAEYKSLLRQMRRHKLEAVGVAGVIGALLVPLIVFVNASFIFMTPVIAATWLFLYLPFWRRKVRRAARSAPRWELHPE